ncbi:hypothetical protein JMJ56_32660, partial [Belnapia sp. T18]|nr:hypothetical protein [Belnapia arida]
MADDRLPLVDLLAKAGDDFFRSVAEAVLQVLMEADVEGLTDGTIHQQVHRLAARLRPRHLQRLGPT